MLLLLQVKVLPNLTVGRLVAVTKKLPDNTQFDSWNQMKRLVLGIRLC
jgi:hypothetical protein